MPYNQTWLRSAIPYPLNKIDRCHRYAPRNETKVDGQCSADLFDNTKLIECSEYVYAGDEKNVQTEVRPNSHLKKLRNISILFPIIGQCFSSTFTAQKPINLRWSEP